MYVRTHNTPLSASPLHRIILLPLSPRRDDYENDDLGNRVCTTIYRLQKRRPSPPHHRCRRGSIDLIAATNDRHNTPIKYIITRNERNVDIDKSKYLPGMPMLRLNHLVISSLAIREQAGRQSRGPKRSTVNYRRRRFEVLFCSELLKGPHVFREGEGKLFNRRRRSRRELGRKKNPVWYNRLLFCSPIVLDISSSFSAIHPATIHE